MKKVLVFGFLILLPGCAGGIAAGSLAGIGAIAPSVIQAVGVGSNVLSEISKAACAAQAAANIANDVAMSKGNVAWAKSFSEMSKMAGVGCSW